jgi:hypothetical protein
VERLEAALTPWTGEERARTAETLACSAVDDRALVALALLSPKSDPQQKELMVRLVLNLLDEG